MTYDPYVSTFSQVEMRSPQIQLNIYQRLVTLFTRIHGSRHPGLSFLLECVKTKNF